MARKSRYQAYVKAIEKRDKEPATSSSKSILKQLKDLKDREFLMKISIPGGNVQ